MKQAPSASAPHATSTGATAGWTVGVVVVVLTVAAMLGGVSWLLADTHRKQYRNAAQQTLEAVAELKVAQIVRWRQERLADGTLLFRTPYTARRALDVLATPDSKTTRGMFLTWLDRAMAGGSYREALLLDDHLNVRLAHPRSPASAPAPTLCDEVRQLAETALRRREVLLSDVHRGNVEGQLHASLIIPLLVRREGDTDRVPAAGAAPTSEERSAGVLILVTDLDDFLNPTLAFWPGSSRTAETLLAHRQGDSWVCVNRPRHLAETAPSQGMSTNQPSLPAHWAAQGGRGCFGALDYRGHPVLAVVRDIPKTAWYIVAKMDKAEVFEGVLEPAIAGLTALGLVLLSTILAGGLIGRQRALSASQAELADRRRTQAALQASETRYRTLVENIPLRIFLKDTSLRYLSCNHACARDLGLTPETLAGKTDADLHPEPLARKYHDDDRRVLATGGTEAFEETCWLNGTARTIQTFKTAVKDAEGQVVGLLGAFWDISDRKRLEHERALLEAQLRQQQRLESLGTLAGGVAHEINNPINGIMNYAQLLRDRLPSDHTLQPLALEILRETQRIAQIVRNLLTFARTERSSQSPARLADILEGVLSLIRTVIRHDQILLEVDLPEDLPPLRCQAQQIQQVLLNLVTNARDALNERYPGSHPDKRLRLTGVPFEESGRPWIRLTVEDHGNGIAPEVRDRMFDPFFTTKPRDRGTGLGLSISHGIVQEHNGRLAVDSERGQFTRLHLELPIAGRATALREEKSSL